MHSVDPMEIMLSDVFDKVFYNKEQEVSRKFCEECGFTLSQASAKAPEVLSFDEKLENYHLIGTVLVFIGVYLAKKKNVKKNQEKFVTVYFNQFFYLFFSFIIFIFLSKKFTISP